MRPPSMPPISACRSRSSTRRPNPGGVCLYRGCIPSKALLHVAKVIDEARHASAWGVTFGEPTIDIDKLRSFKQGVVDKLTGGVGQVAKLRKVKFLQGRATLTGPALDDDRGPGGGDRRCSSSTASWRPVRSRRGFPRSRSTARE